MSQSKAQLTNPIGAVNITGGVNATGVVTATTFIGDGTALTGIALTGNINTSGIITASEFYGYGGDLDNVGLGTEDSINTTGIITAAAFYGDGSGLTGIGGDLTPLTFTPSNGSIDVGVTTNISILFNKPIQAGVGTITLRTNAADGAIVESFDVGTSSSISISAGSLTINPTNDLAGLTTHFVVIPAGTLQDTYGVDSNTLIDNYSFTSGLVPLFEGELWAAGYNASGTLGQSTLTQYSSPIQIPGTQWSYVQSVYVGPVLALKSDRTLWAWGANNNGALGQNDLTEYSSPVQIPGTQWGEPESAYSTGPSFSIKTDRTLWSWGNNNVGQMGVNNATNYSSPVQIPGTQWKFIYPVGFSGDSVIASKTDGTLWAWGSNFDGQLGQNDRANRSSPIQIPGTQWQTESKYYIQASKSIIAKKTDGTLWVWGSSSVGQLGQNSTTYYSSPIQIPGTQWDKVGGGASNMATKTDGTLWAWGYNAYGGLAQNDVVVRSSPVQIPGTQWDIPRSMYTDNACFKTDGTLWWWGRNNSGQGWQNDAIARSSPVQIPGTQWYDWAGKVYHTYALKRITP